MAAPTFDERAGWFDEHYLSTRGRTRLALVLERLVAAIEGPTTARILDAGGGSGAFAIPLAERGHDVTLLEPSGGMLEVARRAIAARGVTVRVVEGDIARGGELALGPYDVICCHAVLLYLDDPQGALASLRGMARRGTILSILEKNADGLALRPGMAGDYAEAIRLLDDPISAGNLGIPNRARSMSEWTAMLEGTGWQLDDRTGVRLFSDSAPDDLAPERFDALLELERRAGRREPYRSVARLHHLLAHAR